MRKHKVTWSSHALKGLSDIYSFVSYRFTPSIAEKVVNGIFEYADQLKHYPYSGPIETKLIPAEENCRYLVYKHTKILYQVKEKEHEVFIRDVFDVRQHISKLKKT